MSTTLSTSLATGIVLTAAGAYRSPFTIESTGTITPATGYAVTSSLTNVYLSNAGLIDAPDAIQFTDGGTVKNTASITGGIVITGDAGTITNSGYIYAVTLDAGGIISNTATLGSAAFFANATLLNAGKISTPHYTYAVQLRNAIGGTFKNTSLSSVIYGGFGAIGASGISSITNHGTIYGKTFGVRNHNNGLLTVSNLGAGALIEAGKPIGFAGACAIYSSYYNDTFAGGVSITNQGSILSPDNDAIFFDQYANISNTGLISGRYYAAYVSSQRVSTIDNHGTITSARGVAISATNADITNAGTASSVYAAQTAILLGTGIITNHGTITGRAGYGIEVTGAATITNAGTIGGAAGAIYFDNTGANKLIIDPGAVFTGAVTADGTSSTIEFATGTGTIANFGSQFIGFEAITISTAATWDFTGATTLAAALTNNGTIAETKNDTLTITGPVTGTGEIKLAKPGVTITGVVAHGETLAFTGTSQTLALADPQSFLGKIEKFKTGDTIDLTTLPQAAILSTHFAKGILTLTETGADLKITFSNPAAFGTDQLTLFTDGAGTGIKLTQAAPGPFPTNPTFASTLVPFATFVL